MKILVIDDDPTVQAVLEGLLSTIGTVTVVGDAFTAIETVEMAIATGEPFKLICLDIGLPSEDGLTTLEAMAYGIPVIASRATCHPELCGDAAAYFDPDDPNELAETIHQLLTNDDIVRELIARGRERVRLFSWDACAGSYAELIEEVASPLSP